MATAAQINWQAWFVVLWAVVFAYALGSRLLSLKGTPGGLREPRKEDVIFDETYASARSHKSTLTRLARAKRCIHVSVTRNALLVRPHFPFSLVGSDADLIHNIPIFSISDVRQFSEPGISGIAVSFSRLDGPQRIDLTLKRTADFLAAVSLCLSRGKEPNEATEPTPASVTPPAGQQARQP